MAPPSHLYATLSHPAHHSRKRLDGRAGSAPAPAAWYFGSAATASSATAGLEHCRAAPGSGIQTQTTEQRLWTTSRERKTRPRMTWRPTATGRTMDRSSLSGTPFASFLTSAWGTSKLLGSIYSSLARTGEEKNLPRVVSKLLRKHCRTDVIVSVTRIIKKILP